MKRYEPIPTVNTKGNQFSFNAKMQESKEGEWVKWEDVEEYIREVEASLKEVQYEINKSIADTLTHLRRQVNT